MSFQAGLAAGAAEALAVAGADALASGDAEEATPGAGIAEVTGAGAALVGVGDVAAGCEAPQENTIGLTNPTAITIPLLGLLVILCLLSFKP